MGVVVSVCAGVTLAPQAALSSLQPLTCQAEETGLGWGCAQGGPVSHLTFLWE